MTGTASQIEWAEQIKPRVDAEFDRVAKAVWSKYSSNVVTLVDRDGVHDGLYVRWLRRSPGSTVSDQNRSCRTTLSTPNTKITSHPPDLTHKKIVSSCPSIRLSTLSVKTAKQASAPIW